MIPPGLPHVAAQAAFVALHAAAGWLEARRPGAARWAYAAAALVLALARS